MLLYWVIVLISIGIIIRLDKIHTKKHVFTIIILLLFIGAITLPLANLFQLPKETIKLTALNEHGQNSRANEIIVAGINVDGIEYNIEPMEGKWFWLGDNYVWRPAYDLRQPEGVTSSITLSLPIGKIRTVEFITNGWQGMVELSYEDYSETIDTAGGVPITIPASKPHTLRLLNIINLGYRLIIYLLLLGLFMLLKIKIKQNVNKVTNLLYQHWDKFLFVLIGTCSIIIMIKYSNKPPFWNDELLQLGISYNDNSTIGRAILNVLTNCSQGNDFTPPLYGILGAIWIRLVPYGQNWIYLLNEIFVFGGIVFSGMIGSKIQGKMAGIFSCVFAATSANMLLSTCYEFRAYALYFFTSSLVLFFYIRRLRHAGVERTKDIIFLGIAFAFFLYSHYHAAVICFILFIVDCIMWFYKKIHFKCVLSYVLAGLAFLPWLIKMFYSGGQQALISQSWHPKPTLDNIIRLYYFLCDGKYYSLFIFSSVLLAIMAALKYNQKKSIEIKDLIGFILVFIIFMMIALIAFFGYFINTNGGSGFVYRYFIGLFPYVYVIIGLGITYTLNWLIEKEPNKKFPIMLVMSSFFGITLFSSLHLAVFSDQVGGGLTQPFREMAYYLMQQSDIYAPETAIVLQDDQGEGLKYFISRKGERDLPQIINFSQLEQYNFLDKIYFCEMQMPDMKYLLNEDYVLVDEIKDFALSVYQRQE